MLIDAHAHFKTPDELPARARVRTIFCGTNPETAAQALTLCGENQLVCFGLHPWYADRFTVDDMLPFIRQGIALGEIGLDNVWCDVDMDRQRSVFHAQLELARSLGMPVILHTKGMEKEIAEVVRPCSVPKLVHWYSCDAYLEEYLKQDCYFTVGPDHVTNPAVQAVLRSVPLNRILTETDGLDAVAWALNRPVTVEDIETAIRGELAAIADVRGISLQAAEEQVEDNLNRFLGRRGNAPV